MKKIFVTFLILLVSSTWTSALAQSKHGYPTLSLMTGGYAIGSNSVKSDMTYGLKLGYEFNGGRFSERLYIDAIYQWIDGELESNGNDVDVSLARIDLLYPFRELESIKNVVPFLAVGAGVGIVNGEDEDSIDPLAAYGVGAKYLLDEALSLRLDLRHVLVFDDDRRDDYEYTLGLSYRFGVEKKTSGQFDQTDTDKDGVIDLKDKCADTPEGLKVDKRGCPVNAPDSDSDGIADYMDKCPDTPSDLSVDAKGCFYDDDGDGVPNEKDRCPANPLSFPVDEKGCTKLSR